MPIVYWGSQRSLDPSILSSGPRGLPVTTLSPEDEGNVWCGVPYVLGKCWLIFPGQCLLPSPYTSYEALLAPRATKDAHWLLSLGLANHPTGALSRKSPGLGGS